MEAWKRFKLAVKRKETPFYAALHDIARAVMGISMPVIPVFHSALYSEWAARTSLWHDFWRIFYYEPMFKSQCRAVGKDFKMWYGGNGVTRILGNLEIYLGDNVRTFDNISLCGVRIFDKPELKVGNNVYLGPSSRFMIAKEVSIGDNTIIGSRNMIVDNPGHPSDAWERLARSGGLPSPESVKPVSIGAFCFFGADCYIYPGAQVGDGVVSQVGTHIKGNIPPFVTIAGNPCRVIKALDIPERLEELAGKDRFAAWHEERRLYFEEHGEPKR